MPKVVGLLDYFPELEEIPASQVIAFLNRQEDPKILINELGNRILYPQTLPTTQRELMIDMAILQASISLQPSHYFDSHLKRFHIPEILLTRFPNLYQLILVLVKIFKPQDIVTLFLKTTNLGDKSLGTLLRPKVTSREGTVNLTLGNEKFSAKIGSLVSFPAPNRRVDFKFESRSATLVGKNNLLAEVPGGQLGLIVDTTGG